MSTIKYKNIIFFGTRRGRRNPNVAVARQGIIYSGGSGSGVGVV